MNDEYCGKCDYGWLDDGRRCPCVIRKMLLPKIGERFVDASLDNFEPRNASAKKAKEKISANPDGSFFIYGDLGTGKSHLVRALYHRDLEKGRYDSKFTTDWSLRKSLIASEMGGAWPEISVTDFTREGCRALFWDDIGKREKYTPFLRSEIFAIIDEIYARNLRLVISSNLDLNALADEDMLDQPTCRRIDEICEPIELRI